MGDDLKKCLVSFLETCSVLHRGHTLSCLEQNNVAAHHTGDIPHRGRKSGACLKARQRVHSPGTRALLS